MKSLSRAELERALSDGKIQPLYLLLGPERYLRDAAARAITNAALATTLLREFNETSFSFFSDDVQSAIAAAGARIRAAGKASGILTSAVDAAARYLELDFTFVAVGSDAGVLARGASALAAECKAKAASLA